MKQITKSNLCSRVKNPNWPEANQLTIYKRCRGFELGTTVKNVKCKLTFTSTTLRRFFNLYYYREQIQLAASPAL